MQPRRRAVLFDLDGTLLDTLEDLAQAMNAALGCLGLPGHPTDAYRTFVGDGVVEMARRALPSDRRDEATVGRCVNLMGQEYASRWDATTAPYDGVPRLLDALAEREVPMAVLSNKPHDFTVLCVSRLLPHWHFEAVLGVEPERPPKPDPRGAAEAAGRLGVPSRQVLYLGDTNTDMRTATAAGMFPAGALWGFRSAEELTASGARALVETPPQVLELL
ncbi:MAG: HAD family hydrolase [Candidatus Brocadiia bacterium]